MTHLRFRVVPLDGEHDRSSFHSGSVPLDTYFHRQVSQDIKRHVTACFVALDPEGRIAAYYTLVSASINLSELPEAAAKKLPRSPTVPAVRMGRLAVDESFKGLGLGGALLADALDRILKSEIAAYALVVDAKDGIAADFYLHHGMTALPSSKLNLFLTMETAKLIHT